MNCDIKPKDFVHIAILIAIGVILLYIFQQPFARFVMYLKHRRILFLGEIPIVAICAIGAIMLLYLSRLNLTGKILICSYVFIYLFLFKQLFDFVAFSNPRQSDGIPLVVWITLFLSIGCVLPPSIGFVACRILKKFRLED